MENQETIDFDTYRLYAMYADGVPVVDIADSFGVSVSTIYKRLNKFPKKYEEAKKQLITKRNAKYRRIGALSIDLQLKYLEEFPADDREKLEKEIRNIQTIGENAERRADLNEGKATDRVESVGRQLTPEEWKELLNSCRDAGIGIDRESIEM